MTATLLFRRPSLHIKTGKVADREYRANSRRLTFPALTILTSVIIAIRSQLSRLVRYQQRLLCAT